MKAQVSVEFILIFSLFVLFLLVSVIFSWRRVADMDRVEVESAANNLIDYISGKVDEAYMIGSGYRTKVWIDERLRGRNFSIYVKNASIILSVGGVNYSRRTVAPEITGTLKKGENIIRNVNGVVVIE